MNSHQINVGDRFINLDGVAGCHWEASRTKLIVHFIGGRFAAFTGSQARNVWAALTSAALVLEGE